jgi:hypothetical protein
MREFDHCVPEDGQKREVDDMIRRVLAVAGIFFLGIVVLTHVAEHWRILPGMGWGLPDSPGHYLDLTSAVLGVGLLLAALL